MSKRCLGCMKKYDEAYDICPHCGYVEGTPAKEAYHMAVSYTHLDGNASG